MNQNIDKQQMHIGIDDTDSTKQGCTTYTATLLLEKLEKLGATFLDYPNLIRLNPNIPWKTRGNGALCLRIQYNQTIEEQIKNTTIQLVIKQSDLQTKGTDPGIVFLKTKQIPPEITQFAKKTETNIVTIKKALTLIQKYHAEAWGYNTQRGIIGALAAIGETLNQDHTYELITYRKPTNIGKKRQVDTTSIQKMDQTLQPYTYNNIDPETNRVIITPRGPDPILFGIRGETPQIVKQAFEMIKPLELIQRWTIFRTNQGTDMHLTQIRNLNQAKPYTSIIATAIVSQTPKIIQGRHVIFAIKDQTATLECAAYEPTGSLRKIARELIIGDQIEAYGSIRKKTTKNPLTLNLEKINILQLAQKTQLQNPKCPNCNKRLKSMGKNQPLRCEKCKTKFTDAKKIETETKRKIETGLYLTSTSSQRHLTKPLRRYGLEKQIYKPEKMIEKWHFKA